MDKRRLMLLARLAFIVVVIVAAAIAIVSNWDDIDASLRQIGAARFAVSAALGILALAGLCASWRALLGPAASSIPTAESWAVYSASQLGKYVPGSVWPLLAQMSLTRRGRISRTGVAMAFLMQMILVIVAAVAVAVIALPFGDARALRERWWLIVVLAGLVALLRPSVVQWLVSGAARLFKRELTVTMPSQRALLISVGLCAMSFVAYGAHLYVLADPVATDGGAQLAAQCIGAFALAWVSGFIIIIAPAGLGVRDVVLAVALTSFVTDSTALTLTSRVSLIISDAVGGVIGVLYLLSIGALTRRDDQRASTGDG